TLFNGIMGRWKGIAIDVRDTLTKNNIAADSLNFANLILAQNGFNFDKAGSPATTGGSAFVPPLFGGRTGSYFGGSVQQTTYVGAADPAGAKWWQGWTAYNIN